MEYGDTIKVPYSIEAKIFKMRQNNQYKKLSSKELKEISNKFNLKPKLIQSLIVAHLRNANIINMARVKKNIKKIKSQYTKNEKSFEELAKEYKVSPLSILRAILRPKKISLKDQHKLSDKEMSEVKRADSIDSIEHIDQLRIKHKATEFEEVIGKILTKNKSTYYTEQDLRQQAVSHAASHATSHATPDFLLKHKITINGRRVAWVEVKNYYGANTKFIKRNIKKQIDRYTKKWGDGCLVFRYGVSESLHFDKTLIISF